MMRARVGLLVAVLGALLCAGPALAQRPTADELLAPVVRIKTVINPDARTTKNLGREREGSGIVIDENGLVLTIGYLMVEAHTAEVTTNDGRTIPANIVGYDHETGFGIVQAIVPLKIKPIGFGKSSALAKDETVLIASGGGASRAAPARIAAKREFAGSWEYLLDEAIFTSPPHPTWSGAALINREGKLVGVGSLIVGDAAGDGSGEAGNMFVPIDLLAPILGDLIADGKASRDPRPWIGLTTNEVLGRLVVSQVSPQGPAEKAGLRRGDIITGVGGESAKNLPDLYRKIWARGNAGATVPLDFEREGDKRKADLTSMNRLDHLKLKSTY
jgi:serine protease Do